MLVRQNKGFQSSKKDFKDWHRHDGPQIKRENERDSRAFWEMNQKPLPTFELPIRHKKDVETPLTADHKASEASADCGSAPAVLVSESIGNKGLEAGESTSLLEDKDKSDKKEPPKTDDDNLPIPAPGASDDPAAGPAAPAPPPKESRRRRRRRTKLAL